MAICCCSLAGTAACRTCSNNPFAECPPTIRTNTITATDAVIFTGRKTNADDIRERVLNKTDEELARALSENSDCLCKAVSKGCCESDESCFRAWLKWLKQEVEDG